MGYFSSEIQNNLPLHGQFWSYTSRSVASAFQPLIGFVGDKFGQQITLMFMITFNLMSTLTLWLISLKG